MTSKLSCYYEMLSKVKPIYSAPKFWNYIKYRSLKRRATISIHRYTPQIASLLVTARCNLKCEYCSVGKFLRKESEKWHESEATLEKVKLIFANPLFSNSLLVDLLGGEPLLNKDIDRIVSYLTKRGHLTNISTNGLLLAERIAELKNAGISRINVSFYDANRSIIERDLIKINCIFPVHMSVVLLRSKLEKEQDDLLESIRFMRDAGCRGLTFWLYRPMGINPDLKEIIHDSFPAYMEFQRRVEEIVPGFCFWPAAIQRGKMKKLCSQLWQRIECDILGNMKICCGTDNMLEGPNSNLFDSGPDIVFNHPTLVGIRERLLDIKSEPPDMCKTCNLLGEPGW